MAPPPEHGKVGMAESAFSRLHFSDRTGRNPMVHGHLGMVAQVSIPAQRPSKLVFRITQDSNRVDLHIRRHLPVGGKLGRGSKRIGRNDATTGGFKSQLVAPSTELLVPSPSRHCIESRECHSRHGRFERGKNGRGKSHHQGSFGRKSKLIGRGSGHAETEPAELQRGGIL